MNSCDSFQTSCQPLTCTSGKIHEVGHHEIELLHQLCMCVDTKKIPGQCYHTELSVKHSWLATQGLHPGAAQAGAYQLPANSAQPPASDPGDGRWVEVKPKVKPEEPPEAGGWVEIKPELVPGQWHTVHKPP